MQAHTRYESIVVAGSVALASALALLNWAQPDVIADLTVEDGVVEYLTAAAFLVAAVGFAAAGLRRSARKLWAFPIALACFVVAGEEVSWGQRLLGLSTPEGLEDVNVQGEMNLHNIEGIHGIVRALALLVLLTLFVLLPIAARHVHVVGRMVERLRFPLPGLAASALIVIGIAFMAVPRLLADEVSFPLDELGELFVAAAWLLYAYGTWSAAGHAPRTGHVAGEARSWAR